LSKFIRNYGIIILFILFTIEWAITTWIWISSNQILIFGDKLYHFFFLLTLVTIPYFFMSFSPYLFELKAVYKEWKNLGKVYNFFYGILLWGLARIIEFTLFNNFTKFIITQLVLAFFFILTAIYGWTLYKHIIVPVVLSIFLSIGLFTFFIEPYSDVDFWMVIVMIIVWCFMLIGSIFFSVLNRFGKYKIKDRNE
ncbi:hypothetical protein LCGC14_1792850, partial [marine sediment metagenome]